MNWNACALLFKVMFNLAVSSRFKLLMGPMNNHVKNTQNARARKKEAQKGTRTKILVATAVIHRMPARWRYNKVPWLRSAPNALGFNAYRNNYWPV